VQLQELQIALSLDHPNLIRCYGAGEVTLAGNAFLYLLMELAEGTLQDCLEQGPVPSEALKQIIRDVAAGLAHLHQSQQSHLDIKPGNILKVGDRWKIGDYGLVRSLNPTRSCTVTNNPLGTPLYMPPESYDGILSPAWDVWSLGIMTASLLMGEYPIRYRTENELSEKIKTGNFDNLQWDALPSPWRSIIQGCLQINRGDRWTAGQVLGALRPVPQVIQISNSSQINPQITKKPVIQSANSFFVAVTTIQHSLKGGVSLDLIHVPGGAFMMGAPDNDLDAKDNEKPQHLVIVKAFAIGKYPITQAQYEAVMRYNPSKFGGNPNKPVERVTWHDAQRFCEKLSQVIGKKYRLPSEAEWEYACRAGTTTRYYFGDCNDQLGDYAWFYKKNSNNRTHPVGEKQPNRWGLYDMNGNVWEWCEDTWYGHYQKAPNNGAAIIQENNNFKVLRGGSWDGNAKDCRSSSRIRNDFGARNDHFGFRIAISL
jgi:formylglycine-generating enzyme required for sulfatase activity